MKQIVHTLYFSLVMVLFFVVAIIYCTASIHAQAPDEMDYQEAYVRGRVIQILKEGYQTFDSVKTYNETLRVNIQEGNDKGKIVTVGFSSDPTFTVFEKLVKGDTVVIDSKPDPTGKMKYYIYDIYRVTNLWWLLGGFIVLIILVTGKKGIGALLGLTISIATITVYIIPQLIQGKDPLTICVVGCCMILFFSTYIAHGISLKTTVAILGTGFSLILAVLLALLSVHLLHILGLGNQDLNDLQLGTAHKINPEGLLLGGILIGTLGALNDITTTQAITIFTLAKENPTQHFVHLFWKSMAIGREHIASLINTLVLAYAGSSMGIFIFLALNPAHLPFWLIINDETTMEEIVRTLVGSSTLILAVPITTLLAVVVALHWKIFTNVVKQIVVN